MADAVKLNIVSPNSEFPYEKAYKLSMPLVEFKRRIELVSGVYIADMRLSLLNEEGKFQAELKNEGSTLNELGVCDGYTIRVEDASGRKFDFGADNGAQEHYVMDTNSYKQRDNTFLTFKKSFVRSDLAVGMPCAIESKVNGTRTGVIAFIGKVHFKPHPMIGVVLDEALGKHDGSIDEKRYFTCEAPYGVFVDPTIVKPIVAKKPAANKQRAAVNS